MDDQQLAAAISKGDKNAFEQLFVRYYARLVVFAGRFVDDDDTARELVQDVFVAFFEKRESIAIHTSLKSHLYQSVRNRCLNHIKRERLVNSHHQTIYLNNRDDEAYFESSIEQTELEAQIFGLIKALPQKCREVFEMSRFEGIKNDDIAEKLQISKRTVETQISKALKFLRDNLPANLLWLFVLLFC
jgi:RNA polymerase sigma-70 factor (family 1)